MVILRNRKKNRYGGKLVKRIMIPALCAVLVLVLSERLNDAWDAPPEGKGQQRMLYSFRLEISGLFCPEILG